MIPRNPATQGSWDLFNNLSAKTKTNLPETKQGYRLFYNLWLHYFYTSKPKRRLSGRDEEVNSDTVSFACCNKCWCLAYLGFTLYFLIGLFFIFSLHPSCYYRRSLFLPLICLSHTRQELSLAAVPPWISLQGEALQLCHQKLPISLPFRLEKKSTFPTQTASFAIYLGPGSTNSYSCKLYTSGRFHKTN